MEAATPVVHGQVQDDVGAGIYHQQPTEIIQAGVFIPHGHVNLIEGAESVER